MTKSLCRSLIALEDRDKGGRDECRRSRTARRRHVVARHPANASHQATHQPRLFEPRTACTNVQLARPAHSTKARTDYAREAPSTQRSYRYAVEQIKATLGKRKLSEITRPEARRIANGWPRATARVARTMWADAVRDGICDLNPWTNLRLETPKGRKDIDALTEHEIAELADLAAELSGDYGAEAHAIILTLAYTGMRPGELCALHRSDVDLHGLEVVVQRSLDGTGREKAPKNGLARRIILPSTAAEAIVLVPERIGSPYLFHTVRGRRLTKGTLAYFWRNIRAGWVARGGRPIDLYELRHACATMLVERGLNVGDVAFQLGHQDGGRLVMTLYGHPGEDAIRDRLKMAHSQASRTPSVRKGTHA